MISIFNSFIVLLIFQLFIDTHSQRSSLASKANCERCNENRGYNKYYCAENDTCFNPYDYVLQCAPSERFDVRLVSSSNACGCLSETTCAGCLHSKYSNRCSWFNNVCTDRSQNVNPENYTTNRNECPDYRNTNSSRRSSLASESACRECDSKYDNNMYCASNNMCFDSSESLWSYCPMRFEFNTSRTCSCISQTSCESCTRLAGCAWDEYHDECVDSQMNRNESNIKANLDECKINTGLSGGVIAGIVIGSLFCCIVPIIGFVLCVLGLSKASSNTNNVYPHGTHVVMANNPQPATEFIYEKSAHDPNLPAQIYVNTKSTHGPDDVTQATLISDL